MLRSLLRRYRFLFEAFVFLMTLFSVWRLVFFLVNATSHSLPQLVGGLPSFFYGLRLDLAVSAYAVAPLILFAFFRDIPFHGMTFVRRYLSVVTVVISLVLSGNVMIYHFWRSLLNYRALTYLKDPLEALASVTFLQAFFLLFLLGAACSITLLVLFRILRKYSNHPPGNWKVRTLFLTGWLVVSVTAVRGGWQQLPVNETFVFHSKDQFLNHTAVNPVWHLAYDIKMAGITRSNPFARLEQQEMDAEMSFFRGRIGYSPVILETNRPNIVVILLESFTADVIESLHGDKGLTPTLDSVIRQGLLFDRIYSSGFRTDQGIVSVLNGWPATPYHSIMRSTEKSQRLPSVVRKLEAAGYHTSFYYGGAANFSNLGAYLQLEGFDKVMTQDSFSINALKGKWGYHDEVVMSQQLHDIPGYPRPFLSVLMTLSNHEPFDVPGEKRIVGDDDPSRFRNAVRYTDEALRAFFENASTQPWFDSTLFVLVADHAHPLPKKRDILYPHGRHIPMVFAGPVLCESMRGNRVHRLGGHHDLPATLLPQLGLSDSGFVWSKDLLSDSTRSFAYLPFDDNLVWKTESGWFLYDFKTDSITERSFLYEFVGEQDVLNRAKAYMQAHYGAYLDY